MAIELLKNKDLLKTQEVICCVYSKINYTNNRIACSGGFYEHINNNEGISEIKTYKTSRANKIIIYN